jgi:opacity protein-like surface antigen
MKISRILAIALALTISSAAFAQIGLKGIGGGAGLMGASMTTASTTGSSSQSLTGFAIGVGANLGTLMENLVLLPDIGYWNASKSVSAGGVSSDFSTSDFVINANVQYMLGTGQIMPYVGGGLGLNFISTSVDVPAVNLGFVTIPAQTVTGSATRLGINLLGGANYPLNDKMSLGAQFRYVIASDFNHWIAMVTFGYKLDSM